MTMADDSGEQRLQDFQELVRRSLRRQQENIEYLINAVPTGDRRNRLTAANILLLAAIKELEG